MHLATWNLATKHMEGVKFIAKYDWHLFGWKGKHLSHGCFFSQPESAPSFSVVSMLFEFWADEWFKVGRFRGIFARTTFLFAKGYQQLGGQCSTSCPLTNHSTDRSATRTYSGLPSSKTPVRYAIILYNIIIPYNSLYIP